LYIHQGYFFESTGLKGRSSLRLIDPDTGEILKKVEVRGVFAEGIAAIGNRLVQLGWHSEKAIVYHIPDLTPIDEYHYSGEGWGMSASMEHFLISDGSAEIVYRDQHFNKVKSLKIRINSFSLKGINDISRVDGRIYCNVLRDDNIYEVSETSGKVLRILDCSNLRKLAATPDCESVFNGIAYDQQTDTFIVTGKNWDKYFQVNFNP
jgi:glutamine cyclotransferase